jgi:uncharacterized protein (DUF1330 family)
MAAAPQAAGGKYQVRAGRNVTPVEGPAPQAGVIIAFDSVEKLASEFDSPQARPSPRRRTTPWLIEIQRPIAS